MPHPPVDTIREICGKDLTYDQVTFEVSRFLRKNVEHYNWVGIYMIEGGDTLMLKGWDGPAATEHLRIPVGEGICGAAAKEKRTIIVDDVNKDPRYLQCFLNTKSEIVVPIVSEGKVVGEIDIDSDKPGAFGASDQTYLEGVAQHLANAYLRPNS